MNKKVYAITLVLVVSVIFIGLYIHDTYNKNTKLENNQTQIFDPFARYEDTVKITGVLSFSGNNPNNYTGKVPSIDNNSFLNTAKERMNIDFDWLWTAPPDEFNQKLNEAIKTSNLPDILSVDSVNYKALLEKKQIIPWNDALKYASPIFKKWISRDKLPWETSTLENGDIMGLPIYTDPKRNLNIMMIRKDWLDDTGLGIPKTIDEFEKVCLAFIDKKGAKEGVTMLDSVFYNSSNISSFMNMFGAYPGKWIKDDNGNIVAGEVQDESKYALDTLNKWYKKGIIGKDFDKNTYTDLKENIISQKTGILITPWWAMDAYVGEEIAKNKDSKWVSAPIPRAKGSKGAILDKVNVSNYWVISKTCKNPEAIVKLFNLWCDFDKNTPPEANPKNGYVWNWVPTRYFDPYDIQNQHDSFNERISSNDFKTLPDAFNANDKVIWDDVKKYFEWKNGKATYPDDNLWGKYLSRYDKDFAWGTTMRVVENGEYETNLFYGEATKTMTSKKATLDELTKDTYSKIIKGIYPISSFDKYKAKWLDLGGRDIISEVNIWYNEK